VQADEIEESRVRIEQLVMLLKEIKGTCHPQVQLVFQKVASSLEYELDKIRKQEIRINKNNQEDVSIFNCR
jgi:hypothetical protein